MLIRIEIPVDAMGIDQLLRHAFQRDSEATLIQQLRENGLLTLGMVATDDEGLVVGYAAFSSVDVEGEDCQWVGLGPLAVAEPYRGQGIATTLILESLNTLHEFGYAAVVTLGDPAYYHRLGFVAAAPHRLHCRWPDTEATFQIYPLADNALEGVHGRVNYAIFFDDNV